MRNLLYSLLLLSCCLCSFGCGNGEARRAPARNHESTPANMATPAPTPHKSLPKIIAFGDSLTAGLGLRASESYPALLQRKLADEGYQYEVVNAGSSGDTTADGLRRLEWSLEGNVRIVILELGANDFLRGQPVSEARRNLGQMIEQLKARRIRVLLAGIYAPTSVGVEYQKEIHEAFQTLAREHGVVLLPFFLEGVAGEEQFNQPDGIHPNAEGTKRVVENVYRYLRPMLDEDRQQTRP